MPVSIKMIKEFIDAFLKDQAIYGSYIKEFRRLGESGQRKNAAAARMSDDIHQDYYEGHTLSYLITEIRRVYGELSEAGLISRDSLGAHAWLMPYVPFFDSAVLNRLIQKHRDVYFYTDTNEILSQSMAVLILTHYSNPTLFAENVATFELVANTWLEALLTYNCKLNPEIRMAGMSEINQYYASAHGLGYFAMCAEQYHSISFAMSNQFSIMTQDRNILQKWDNKVTTFAAILAILPQVKEDFSKICSPDVLQALKHLQSMKDHRAEYQPISVAVDVVIANPQPQDHHSEAPAIAAPVVAAPLAATEETVPVAIGIDAEQARIQALGARMLFRGVGRLANPEAPVPHDPEIEDILEALPETMCRMS